MELPRQIAHREQAEVEADFLEVAEAFPVAVVRVEAEQVVQI